MFILPNTLIKVASLGGGFIVDLEKTIILPDTMMQIAAAASNSGAKIIFKVGKTIVLPDTMIRVAAAGRGAVIFDIT